MTNYNALNFSDAQPNTDLTFQYTNNFIFGSAFNDGGGGGVTLAALPSPILGGDVLVGDYWGYPNIWGVVYAPVYPAGVTSLSSSAVSVAGTPPLTCQNENSILPTCWPLDWALVGFTDFTGGSAGTDLPGLALAVTSPCLLYTSPCVKSPEWLLVMLNCGTAGTISQASARLKPSIDPSPVAWS